MLVAGAVKSYGLETHPSVVRAMQQSVNSSSPRHATAALPTSPVQHAAKRWATDGLRASLELTLRSARHRPTSARLGLARDLCTPMRPVSATRDTRCSGSPAFAAARVAAVEEEEATAPLLLVPSLFDAVEGSGRQMLESDVLQAPSRLPDILRDRFTAVPPPPQPRDVDLSIVTVSGGPEEVAKDSAVRCARASVLCAVTQE
jgi:hypothetical protein